MIASPWPAGGWELAGLCSGGPDRVPVCAEAVDALAVDLAGLGARAEVVQRMAGVGHLELAVGPLSGPQQ